MDILFVTGFICYGLPIIFLVIVILVWKSKRKPSVKNSVPFEPYVRTGTSEIDTNDASGYPPNYRPEDNGERMVREMWEEMREERRQDDWDNSLTKKVIDFFRD